MGAGTETPDGKVTSGRHDGPATALVLTLRGRILALLVSLAVLAAWLTGDRHASLAASLLLAPMIVDLLFKSRKLHHLQLRVAPARTQAGMPFFEQLEIRSPKRPLHDLTISEPRTVTYAGGALVENLQGGRTATVRMTARSRRRGHRDRRTFRLETRYPFGFVASRAELQVEAELVTEPARIELPTSVLLAIQRGETWSWTDDRAGGDEFHSLREYQPGEDARLVHALRSAATGTLVRKVLRGRERREAWIVLDLRRPPGRRAGRGGRRLEWSLSACASLLDLLFGSARMRCLTIDAEARSWDLDTHAGTSDLLAFMARASAVPHRQLPPASVQDLRRGDVYWFPAGGYLARADMDALDNDVILVGADS